MSKSLLLLTLVVAQLLAGSGGAVYWCWDCGSLRTAAGPEGQAIESAPHCCCCHAVKPAPLDATQLAACPADHDNESPIPLLSARAPSRPRDSESVLISRLARDLTAPLSLNAADIHGGQGFVGPREDFVSTPAAHLTALATVCLRC